MSGSLDWAKVDGTQVPRRVTPEIPGPCSQALHARATAIMKGYSGQVRLVPVVFDKGRIVQDGTYQDLIARPGPFQELAKRQLV